MDSISEQVEWFIAHHILSPEDPDNEGITHDTDLRKCGILSSLWIIKLASFLEERFQIRFDVTDFGGSHFSSIADIERLVRAKLSEAS
jgi:acyl carrier protein